MISISSRIRATPSPDPTYNVLGVAGVVVVVDVVAVVVVVVVVVVAVVVVVDVVVVDVVVVGQHWKVVHHTSTSKCLVQFSKLQ